MDNQLILIILSALVGWGIYFYQEKRKKNSYYEKYKKAKGYK